MSLEGIHTMLVRETSGGVRQFVNVREYFTCGHCWELAEALTEIIPGARVIEIRVCEGAWNMLVHAGVEVEGWVIDIEGVQATADWLEKWSASRQDPAISYRTGRGEFLGFETRRTMDIARHVGNLLIDAVATDLRIPVMKKAA